MVPVQSRLQSVSRRRRRWLRHRTSTRYPMVWRPSHRNTERQHDQGRGLAYPSNCQEASVMPDGITKVICRSRRRARTGVLAALSWRAAFGANANDRVPRRRPSRHAGRCASVRLLW